MKTSDIRAMTFEELEHKAVELKSSLMHLRFQKKIGQLTDTSQINKTRKDIARVLTILKEKEKENGEG